MSVRPAKAQISLSLIRIFAVRSLGRQQRLWSEWVDAQADLSLRWAHSYFVGFVMFRLILVRDVWQICLDFSEDKVKSCICLSTGTFYIRTAK